MLVRSPQKLAAEQRKEQRRIHTRRRVKEYRARMRKGLAVYPVTVDDAVLELLVQRKYLTEDQLTDKVQVSKALTAMLWDPAHAKNF